MPYRNKVQMIKTLFCIVKKVFLVKGSLRITVDAQEKALIVLPAKRYLRAFLGIVMANMIGGISYRKLHRCTHNRVFFYMPEGNKTTQFLPLRIYFEY